MALQIRRGTNAERLLITPLEGELIFTTDTKRLYVGDGTTLGGVEVDTNTGGGGGASTLNELTDVAISSPTNGQVLKYNGTAWVNGADLNDGATSVALDDITNVTITNPTIGQVLKYNGTSWVNDTDSVGVGGTSTLDDLTDVIVTTPTTGQVLTFNGTAWINEDTLGAVTSVNGETGTVVLTTTNIAEGTNFYFTQDRAQDAAALMFVSGTHNGISFSYDNLAGTIDADVNVTAVGPIDETGLRSNLVTNGFPITSVANQNVVISPSGTGEIELTSTTSIVGNLNITGLIRRETAGALSIAPVNGPVNIGSASLNRSGNLYVIRNDYSSTFGQGFTFAQHHNTADAVNFSFYKTRGTSSAPLALQNGDDIADIAFLGHDGTNGANGAAISVIVDGTPTLGHVPTKFAFATDNGTTLAFRAELDKDGVWKVNSIQPFSGTSVSMTGVTVTTSLRLPTYVDATARDAAIPSPQAGMVVLTGTVFQGYNGSTWVALS